MRIPIPAWWNAFATVYNGVSDSTYYTPNYSQVIQIQTFEYWASMIEWAPFKAFCFWSFSMIIPSIVLSLFFTDQWLKAEGFGGFDYN